MANVETKTIFGRESKIEKNGFFVDIKNKNYKLMPKMVLNQMV